MTHAGRDRVTVDLRGLGERLRLQAAARRLSSGAFVRRAILAQLEAAPAPAEQRAPDAVGPVVKVTLRLTAAQAVQLASRARAADVSQSAYFAGLLAGTPPPPLPPDHTHTVAALVASTDQLAVLSADISGLVRALLAVDDPATAAYRNSARSLNDDVRKHLGLAAELLQRLRPAAAARTPHPAPKRR